MRRLFIANRGEIALRIARAAAELGIETVGVHAEDDADAPHCRAVDRLLALPGSGPRAYLDADRLVALAGDAQCDALHPGYGFLSENAAFARLCAERGLVFVGPSPDTLALLGDKAAARERARALGLPLLPGTRGGAGIEEMEAFFDSLGEGARLMIKAVGGGGGRGIRAIGARGEIAQAHALCASEARQAFGNGDLYAERLVAAARHVEVQIIGDGIDAVTLFERDCTIQRHHQKLIEIAPALDLPETTRAGLAEAALGLARLVRYRGLGTVEFLVDADEPTRFYFLEVNPRLQVEHPVSEAVTGIDLVRAQLMIAGGASLGASGLEGAPAAPRGAAIELRLYAERLGEDGTWRPASGRLLRFEPPSGPGVRVDAGAYAGYAPPPAYDPLIAKLIVHVPDADLGRLAAKARRALGEFGLEGLETNAPLLDAILSAETFLSGAATTRFLDEQGPRLLREVAARAPRRPAAAVAPARDESARRSLPGPPGTLCVPAPLRGTIVALDTAVGAAVMAGEALVILEAMKMQHVVAAPAAGVVRRVDIALGETAEEGQALVHLEVTAGEAERVTAEAVDLDHIRGDLAEVLERQAKTQDEARPAAVARRRRTGQRTARENLADLFDPGSFKEYGALALAAQRRRRSLDDLIAHTPADGMIAGIGSVNAARFGEERARCVGLAYDFTVLAGTQGFFNHKKTDRMLELAEHWQLPVIWFTEGGGGRPGDVDTGPIAASSLDTTSFSTFARLSGLAPRISINSGRCFAGNALFFGAADITIATRDSNIGLGGPAMIEGGGLGRFAPEDIGPAAEHWRNGTLDILAEDEGDAVRAAKALLACFQGALEDWTCADQRHLRHLIPENRVRAYDIRRVIETLADTGTFIELRGGYGIGMITGFLRIEVRPLGLLANNPFHLGGAIDAEGAEKGARFLQLCDAFGIPILSLCDTPGFMVGPDSERTAAVRRGSRLFVTWTSLSVPTLTVVLRKGYGLGAQAMAAGDFSAPAMTIAWPTGEFGPMGFEGAVRLGFKKELDAETDPAAQKALFEKLVQRMYQTGKAVSVASVLEIDAVIDPAETRGWILRGLKTYLAPSPGRGKKRPFIDVW